MSDTSKYLIRTASPSDIEALIALCVEHAAYEGARYDPRDKSIRLADALFTASPRLYAWVVEQQSHLVGYATATQEFSTWDAASFLHMDCLYLREEVRSMDHRCPFPLDAGVWRWRRWCIVFLRVLT